MGDPLTPELIDQLLCGNQTLVMSNPVLSVDCQELKDACERFGKSGRVLLATSGTSASPRWVILSRDALRGSARAVNSHLSVSSEDVWVCALPVFHVGGLSIYFRADESRSKVFALAGKWNPDVFVETCNSCCATLTSLVPTQLFDLVDAGISVPSSLRALIIGGATLSPKLREEALLKGWPVVESYGMTEAGSQIATQRHPLDEICLLDCWDARTGDDSIIEIRGPNLFSGYLEHRSGNWELINSLDKDGWFRTGDRVKLSGRKLFVLGRSDSVIKILGEKVEMDVLQARIESIAGKQVAVMAMPEGRAGYQLVLLAEEGVDTSVIIGQYNHLSSGPERIVGFGRVSKIPRAPLGKLNRNALKKILDSHGDESFELI